MPVARSSQRQADSREFLPLCPYFSRRAVEGRRRHDQSRSGASGRGEHRVTFSPHAQLVVDTQSWGHGGTAGGPDGGNPTPSRLTHQPKSGEQWVGCEGRTSSPKSHQALGQPDRPTGYRPAASARYNGPRSSGSRVGRTDGCGAPGSLCGSIGLICGAVEHVAPMTVHLSRMPCDGVPYRTAIEQRLRPVPLVRLDAVARWPRP